MRSCLSCAARAIAVPDSSCMRVACCGQRARLLLLCSLRPCLASFVQLPRQAMHLEAEAALWIHVQRAYLGPTSMDTEMAFIMCNLGQVWALPCP